MKNSSNKSKVYKIVEQMPLFPGKNCGDITDYNLRKQCADIAMLNYVYDNIRYSKKAKKEEVKGIAVVNFIVEPYGAISNIAIARNPGAGLGKSAAKVIEKMREDGMRWEPGLHKGKPVRVQFHLPVRFKLK